MEIADTVNLELSRVQEFNPKDFSLVRVHDDGGKGGSKNAFEYFITPSQAEALSIAQDCFQGRGLPANFQEVIATLDSLSLARFYQGTGTWGVTQIASGAKYDLLTK